MPTLAAPRRWLTYLWSGPEDLTRPLKLEWRLVALRWLGILFIAPGLQFLPLGDQRRLVAYGALLFGIAYNLALRQMIQRTVTFVAIGIVSTVADSLVGLTLLVGISDSVNSPLSYFLFAVTVAVAMRYGYGPGLGMALLYVGADAINDVLLYGSLDATFVFFSGFLGITALLASYLREEAHRAEAALQERLRQANLLNATTATLGASLEFGPLLQSVVAAACHLFGSEGAVLRPSSSLAGAGFDLPATVFHPPLPGVLHTELTRLPRRPDDLASGTVEGGMRCSLATLPSGRGALVVALRLPSQQEELATLAMALPQDQFTPAVDPDILASFADRSALAIENASLYRTLARRSDDLQRAYADLASAHQELLSVDEMKTNFLANVSHELRTPLTSIRSFAELLLTYDDPAVREEFLQIIKLESERLTRLVNDVLDITKIESGFMEWRMAPVDLTALLRESARLFESTLMERALIFEQAIRPDLPTVHADADRLQQVIANLLHNAMKFTPRGVISLRAWWTGEEVRIAVADTGRGVALEDQERIFEKFQQVGALLTDKPPGTGLGLAICRDIIIHHQGRLWLQSQPGKGSTFTIALPAPSAAGGDAPALALEGGSDGGGVGR